MRYVAIALLFVVTGLVRAEEPATPPATQPSTRPAIVSKALSPQVTKGLAWLKESQRSDGGWTQGEESANMVSSRNAEQTAAGEKSNVADTCMAMMALLRSGNERLDGEYGTALNRAANFICESIEKSDKDSLWVTDVRGTRTQSKLGTYVDTFLAALVLSEMRAIEPEGPAKARISQALDKTLAKIQGAQLADGGIKQQGWAVALSSGICRKAMNRAAQVGAKVDMDALATVNASARNELKSVGGKVDVAAGSESAGVALYSNASNLQSLQEAVNTDRRFAEDLQVKLAAPSTSPAERKQIEVQFAAMKDNAEKLGQSRKAVVDKMNDEKFTAGFGSNGGEEFLSYWAIGESLVTERDPTFAEWDSKMTFNLNRVQNDDGSWSGHHCITGKTFCTSAALLVLMVDRTTAPAAEKVRERK